MYEALATLERRWLPAPATPLLVFLVLGFLPLAAQATCTAPKSVIEAENCLPGTPASQWYVQGAGSPNIQGFTTDISVNVGQTVFFKISTPAASYRIDIYRLGYYQGNDGRFMASVSPSAPLPQIQPACLSDSATGLIDCGNWAISASWTVPSTATSGVYFARLVRLDNGEVGAIIFVVRNDSSYADVLFQTSDPTWQAYNNYGGNSLYSGNPVGRAFKVSYNRPLNASQSSWDFFAYEYPLVRFLEANGYEVTYSTGVDTDRNGALITQHKSFMSVGHDEYWSGGQRANVEAALAAGVNLAFFSGNEVWWKTRWEPSIDGTNAPYRTLVCYKETPINGSYGGVIDPADPPTWTGIWRDSRFSPPADGGRPENALTGTWSAVSGPQDGAITVPQADGRMRFWRNTGIATLGPGQVATLPQSTLGYESDEDPDNGFRPAGLIRLSTTTVSVPQYLYFSPSFGYYFTNGTETHHLTLYRAPSRALVFGAGTIHWSWGVDSDHAGYTGLPADPSMRQAMVNLFADMGVQPATLQSGLVPATASTDTSPPTSTVTSPVSGTNVTAGLQVTVSGTAQDSGGGVVGGVEVSVDGGATWHPAVGRENWSYVFTAAISGTLNVLSRAVDDSGNLEAPIVTVTNMNSNLCIDTGGSTGVTALIQSSCSTSNTQKFTLKAAPVSGFYYLVSVASNLCWDVTGGSGSAGALIQQYSCFAVRPETYQLKAVSGGYEILSANMTNGCLGVVGASTASGANIEQNTCVGSANQIFSVTANATPPPPPSGIVTLQNTNSNLCIDTGGSTGVTALIQSPCSTSNRQKFTLKAAPVSGFYYLVSVESNLCWDVTGGSGSAGALIQQYTCFAVWPEIYQLKAVSGGYEILSANMTNGCLGVVGASTASGANIEQNTCVGSANQIFNIR